MASHTLVLIRHGQSLWNKQNRFTGWTDVDLSEQGCGEARAAAALLADEGLDFDLAYTSVLKRAIRTLWIILDELDLMWLPVHRAWQLNERHYGALQGLNKAETAAKHGDEQVHLWRRGYGVQPPALEPDDARDVSNDPRYREIPPAQIPRTESLRDTVARVVPYWNDVLAPQVQAGKRLLIAAHGNSLRALVKHLDGVSDEDITQMNIPTGVPLVYQLDASLRPVDRNYLGDQDAIAKAMAAVAAQGKAAAC